MLTSKPIVAVYVRHKSTCPKQKHGEFYHACECPKWLRYSFNGKQCRVSAETRSWGVAEEKANEKQQALDAGTDAPLKQGSEKPTITRAIDLFVADKQSQGLNDGVIKKYTRELERLREFLAKRGAFFPNEITVESLTEYRGTWNAVYESSTTRQKVQERIRGFLRYCYNAQWIERVPHLSPIKVDEPPTLPLSDIEYSNLLKQIPDEFDSDKAKRVHALVQLMRHSGLAIRDAVTLERSEIQKDSKKKCYRIVTNRQKTGTHVSVPIPDAVAEEILVVLNGNPRYVFWNSGNGKEESAVTNWQHDLRKLFRTTFGKDTNFTPHCLRDTFAVDLLQKGVPLEEVSKLLGHESIKTTEKSYAKWVQARQDRLDSLVIGTWG